MLRIIQRIFWRDTWPIEMAIAWVAIGDKKTAVQMALFAWRRRKYPDRRWSTLGMRLAIPGGLADQFGTVRHTMYRTEMRGPQHPIIEALRRVASMMKGKPATALRHSRREQLPSAFWAHAVLQDDRPHGVTLACGGAQRWRNIDVPAAPFRTLKAKRGRRPVSLNHRAKMRLDKTAAALDTPRADVSKEAAFAGIAYEIGVSPQTVKRVDSNRGRMRRPKSLL